MSPEVDAYIAALELLRRERLATLRALVHDTVPGVTEGLDWKMPVFRLGDRWVAIANQKSYISIYLGLIEAATVIATDPKLKGGKSCVNITDKTELPLAALAPAIRSVLIG